MAGKPSVALRWVFREELYHLTSLIQLCTVTRFPQNNKNTIVEEMRQSTYMHFFIRQTTSRNPAPVLYSRAWGVRLRATSRHCLVRDCVVCVCVLSAQVRRSGLHTAAAGARCLLFICLYAWSLVSIQRKTRYRLRTVSAVALRASLESIASLAFVAYLLIQIFISP